MTKLSIALTLLGHFVLALLVVTVLGSIIQTQLNLLALQGLGAEVSLMVRLETTVLDILRFGPVFASIVACSMLLALPMAAWLSRYVKPIWRAPLCALAGAVGLWVALRVVDALAPMPTLIAATRSVAGTLAIITSAALGGWLFARLQSGTRERKHVQGAVPMILLMGLGSSMAVTPEVQADSVKPYRVTTYTEGLSYPWAMVFLPDGRALVTERPGRLRLLEADGSLHPEPFSGLPEIFTATQAGLMDIILAPDFDESQRLYFSYACGTLRANNTCLASAQLGENETGEHRLDNVQEIFRAQPAKSGASHYGGRMTWLPDGTLILTLGDGFDYREQAQNLENHLGKIVRLNADGSAPDNNPFVDRPGAAPEIFSYGHRNVQGIFYDAANQRLLSHEHGPRGGDEINRIEPGKNYGWPLVSHGIDYSGARITPFTELPGKQSPLLDWTPSIAPSGMTLYNAELFADWQGDLFVSALAAKRVHRVRLQGDQVIEEEQLFAELGERIRDVRQGPDGALYLLTDNEQGRVLRVVPR